MLRSIGSVTVLALLMVGCGGSGGGGGGEGGDSGAAPPPPATYTVGGTVTGLAGSGLVLMFRDSALSGPHAVSLAVAASGGFTFAPAVPQGSSYTVYVGTQPSSPTQNCVVTNDAGVVLTNITTVAVACSSTVAGYTVDGTVSGLVGSGLTLGICASSPLHGGGYGCSSVLQVSANGAFTLGPVSLAHLARAVSVSITQQPSSPTQHCVISNAAFSIQSANLTGVTVSCAEYSYVTNAADNTLSAYSIDATTGALAVIGTPIATGASPYAIAGLEFWFDESKRYVFVGNEGSNDVTAFAVNNTTGAMAAVPGSPFAAGTDPKAMAAMANNIGSYNLYIANAGSDNVSAYTIDATTGALAPQSPGPSTIATGKSPTSIIVEPNNGIVFVANHGGSNDISAFFGDLTPWPGSPFPAGGSPLSLALGAAGKFLYSANPDATNPSISGFSIDPTTEALSPLSGSPFPLPVSHYIATDQTGTYLYVTTGANIVGYSIDATTGALTALAGFPVSAGANAYSITIDPTNQLLYVANDGGANVSGFRLDASTGALTPMSGSPFPTGSRPEFLTTF